MRRAGPAFQLTAPRQLEHDLQKQCAKMFSRILLPDVTWTAVDHAHSLNMAIGRHGRPIGLIEAQKRVARGIKPGLPDNWFIHYGRVYLIELKATADDDLSQDQKDFLKSAIASGAEVSICWDIWQVFNKIREWGLCRPSAVMT